MTTITCSLECEHEISWGETPETPSADLPWVGRIVYCPECGQDQEITALEGWSPPSNPAATKSRVSLADAVDAFGAAVAGHYLALEREANRFADELGERIDDAGVDGRWFLIQQAAAIRRAGAAARYAAYQALSDGTAELRSLVGR